MRYIVTTYNSYFLYSKCQENVLVILIWHKLCTTRDYIMKCHKLYKNAENLIKLCTLSKSCVLIGDFKKKNVKLLFFRYFKKIYYESEINKKNVWTNCHPFVISFAGLLLHDQPCSVSWTLHMYFVPKDLRQIPWTWNWKLLFNLFQLFIFIKPLEIESMCRCFNWLLSELK